MIADIRVCPWRCPYPSENSVRYIIHSSLLFTKIGSVKNSQIHKRYKNNSAMSYFKSDRLVYRAIEESDADKAYMHILRLDSAASANSNPRLLSPARKVDSDNFTRILSNEALLGAMICLPPPSSDINAQPKPIGFIMYGAIPKDQERNRNSMITLQIEQEYQRKGYGSEAIMWAVGWAFLHAGMHRVKIAAFAYNTGAVKLYERLGFTVEGRQREAAWHNGEWHDVVDFGILEGEWREKFGDKHK
jgi:RimJ/RimL family protein N-acetyltransferase